MTLFLPAEEEGDSDAGGDILPGESHQAGQAVIVHGAIIDIGSRDPSPGQVLPSQARGAPVTTESIPR